MVGEKNVRYSRGIPQCWKQYVVSAGKKDEMVSIYYIISVVIMGDQ